MAARRRPRKSVDDGGDDNGSSDVDLSDKILRLRQMEAELARKELQEAEWLRSTAKYTAAAVAFALLLTGAVFGTAVFRGEDLGADPDCNGAILCRIFKEENFTFERVRHVPSWNMSLYGTTPETQPVVIVRSAREWPALRKWLQPAYLVSIIKKMPQHDQPPVIVTPTRYFYGSSIPKHWLRPGRPDLVFANSTPPANEFRYIGLMDIRSSKALLQDVLPKPPFLRGIPDGPVLSSTDTREAIWASNSGSFLDSGLHFDENRGGFLTQVVGAKEIILFPPGDQKYLYMKHAFGHRHESKLFLSRDLHTFREKYPLLAQTHPQFVRLQPGDSLFIPHKWFHEVVSPDHSIAYSSWVKDS